MMKVKNPGGILVWNNQMFGGTGKYRVFDRDSGKTLAEYPYFSGGPDGGKNFDYKKLINQHKRSR